MRRFGCLFFTLVFALSIPLNACSPTSPKNAAEVLQAICREETDLPSGKVFLYGLSDEMHPTLTEDMLTALYGDGDLPPAIDEADAAACYLSYAHPFELSLFCAKSVDGAHALAEMLLRRADRIRALYGDPTYGTYLENTKVTDIGRWVLLSVTENASITSNAFRHAV